MEFILFIYILIMLYLVYIWIRKKIVLIGKCIYVYEIMDKCFVLVVDFWFWFGDVVVVILI